MKTLLSGIKSPLIPIVIGAALGFSHYAHADVDYSELAEEIEIMQQVFTTTLKKDNKDTGVKVGKIDAKYFANQGIVFDVATNGGSFSYFFSSSSSNPTFDFDFDFSDIEFLTFDSVDLQEHQHSIQEALSEATVLQRENLREITDQLRNLQSQLRDQEWQLRDVEREKRDLNFELNQADEVRKKEIKEELKALHKASEKANADKQSLKDAAKEISEKRQQKAKLKREKRQEVNQAFLSHFEKDVTDTLCRFGSALRALPKDEHITFMLNKFDVSMENKKASRYYVFPADSVKRCAQEKISPSDLLAKATVYDF